MTAEGRAPCSDRGPPQEHACDLVYRHCLDLEETGDRLGFGLTPGSAQVSETQGDSWDCISTHLPPINRARVA